MTSNFIFLQMKMHRFWIGLSELRLPLVQLVE